MRPARPPLMLPRTISAGHLPAASRPKCSKKCAEGCAGGCGGQGAQPARDDAFDRLADSVARQLAPRGELEEWVAGQVRLSFAGASGARARTADVARLNQWLEVFERIRDLGGVEGGCSEPMPGDEPSAPARLWRDRLTLDPAVSADSPVLKGTTITVQHVVSRIVDGWRWSDLLRHHPGMTEEDIRACLAFYAEEEGGCV